MSTAYQPSKHLVSKISRRITPFLARRTLRFTLERPIVSFTFDDCPVSAIENGVRPLEDMGWKSTIYVSCGLMDTINHHGRQISLNDVQDIHANGHEIGGHTYSHIDAQSTLTGDFLAEIQHNQDSLENAGIPASRTFAYPYGQTQASLKRVLEDKFIGLRGIQPGVHENVVDLNQIKSIPLFSGNRMELAKAALRKAADAPAWITFFTHDIRKNHSSWGCSPDEMKEIIEMVETSGADVLPIETAILKLKGIS